MNGALSYTQRGDFFRQALDVFEYEQPDRVNPAEAVAQIVADWLPADYADIRAEWIAAGCPEPMQLKNGDTIHGAMVDALRELFTDALTETVNTATTYGEAVTLLHAHLATFGHEGEA